MARIPDSFIDELLARTDIVEVINSRVPLKRAGREYQARCPFHDERTPSFTVSPSKQFYHCFGCGAHGTAIKFLMDYDRIEFLDAVEELAQRAGLKVPRETRESRQSQARAEGLYDLVDAAARWFSAQLAGSSRARAYLERRGVDATSIERFTIGYAPPGWDALKNALGTDAIRLRQLDQVGLISKSDSGHVYDKFRDRIIFPIRDRRGRPIAFGGRVLNKDDGPKYLNSPETSLFHKGRELYGLFEARRANAKLARLVVVEGFMDVISLNQHGINEAVATLGTATTREHAELLFRNAPDVYFCFDGDQAGRAAAWRAAEAVLPRMRDGRQAWFVFLPEGEDPDTLIAKEGSAGFEQRLAAATPLSAFFFAHQEADVRLDSADGRARLVDKCKAAIATIPDGAFKDRMLEMLTEKSVMGWALLKTADPALREPAKELLDERLQQTRRALVGGHPSAAQPEPAMRALPRSQAATGTARRSVVRSAITLLVQQPALAQSVNPPYLFSALRQPGVPLLVELIALARARPEITTGGILEHFAGREEAQALAKLAVTDLMIDPAQFEPEFTDCLKRLDRQCEQQRLDELKARLDHLDRSELAEYTRLQRSLRGAASH